MVVDVTMNVFEFYLFATITVFIGCQNLQMGNSDRGTNVRFPHS